MTTPIERLRQRHVAAGFPDNQCCVVLSCGLTWPCDTIAALDALEAELTEIGEARYTDALQARIDAATVLIRQAMEREHYSRHGGVSPSVPAPATCPACAPYREWLGGEGQ